jgi:D-3-phosphoglycerate dehydrogenase / 2-oxoglutarate reductase
MTIGGNRIVVTDCDHDSITIEEAVAAKAGVDLSRADAHTEEAVIAAAREADGIVVQYAPITARVLDALPGLEAVGRYGVGVDNVDVDAATARGVAVCNVPDYGTEDVSDHAIALALAVFRAVVRLDRNIRSGTYDYAPARPLHRARGSVFGVVGLGLIGAATARKARGLGFRVIGSDPRYDVGARVDGVDDVVSPDDLLRTADVISLHVPLNAETDRLIDAGALAKMRPTAVLVNTCRGGVVDTDALVNALTAGRIRGAGLDVFEQEPLPMDHPLAALDNVVLTPHVAWYTEESRDELKRRAVENVVDVVQGRIPRDVLNPQVLSRSSDRNGKVRRRSR